MSTWLYNRSDEHSISFLLGLNSVLFWCTKHSLLPMSQTNKQTNKQPGDGINALFPLVIVECPMFSRRYHLQEEGYTGGGRIFLTNTRIETMFDAYKI